MWLDVRMRYYRWWVGWRDGDGDGGGTASTSPRNAANLSRFFSLGVALGGLELETCFALAGWWGHVSPLCPPTPPWAPRYRIGISKGTWKKKTTDSWNHKRRLPPYNPKENDIIIGPFTENLWRAFSFVRKAFTHTRDWTVRFLYASSIRQSAHSAVPRCRTGAATSEGDMNLEIIKKSSSRLNIKWR